MASTNPGHVAIDGQEFIIVEETYRKQLQTAFNPRFSTGDPNLGDLSFFQYLAMEDFSGGNGQENFYVNNRFDESEGVDVTEQEELKLAPKVEFVASINGPQLNSDIDVREEQNIWPQIIEWLGRPIIYNDYIVHESGGLEWLEVFDTEVLLEKVLGDDPSGQQGIITDDTRAEILSIDKVFGLPNDVFSMKVMFKKPILKILGPFSSPFFGQTIIRPYTHFPSLSQIPIEFSIDFGGSDARQSDYRVKVTRNFDPILFSFTLNALDGQMQLNENVLVDFTVEVPGKEAGIYTLWTSARVTGGPWTNLLPTNHVNYDTVNTVIANMDHGDLVANASVLFFIQSINEVLVNRKGLYAPQLKAATVIGDKLVGGRVFDSVGKIEVYEEQNEAVDRTLEIDFSEAGISPENPTYMKMIGSNDIVIVALDNKIFKVDIATDGISDAERMVPLTTVPGDYVTAMSIWNQRIYIASFDKSNFTSHITWTDETEIEGSYAIDGKFKLTSMANFRGALIYAGGTHDRKGEIRAYPAETLMEVEHPTFDATVRALNGGRVLYAGWSHAMGMIVLTEQGISTWAKVKSIITDSATNIVWDIEEVGDNVFFLGNHSIYKTTSRYNDSGFLVSSRIGGNTPLIDKNWESVRIETEPMEGSHKINVLCTNSKSPFNSWINIGEMTQADGVIKEFDFPAEYSSSWVKIRLELVTTDDTTTPVVKKMLVKYVPSALTKLQWVFSIRADNNLKLLNGEGTLIKGSDILNNVFDFRSKGKLEFRDIDGEFYSTVLTDIRQVSPIIDKNNLEGLVAIEMLET